MVLCITLNFGSFDWLISSISQWILVEIPRRHLCRNRLAQRGIIKGIIRLRFFGRAAKWSIGQSIVKALLSPRGAYLILYTSEGGLIERGFIQKVR